MKTNKYSHKKSPQGRSGQFLTVIIPAFNEIAYLPDLLDALKAQTRLPDEVIVADAGSMDGTAELAKARGAQVVRGGMPAFGRNAGADAAKGDLLLFLDADVLPPPNFIVSLLEEFEQKGYDVATCFIAAKEENSLDRMICLGTNLYSRIIQPLSPRAPGCCILSKRNVHEKIGGFDESLALSEDIDYARRAKQYGKFGILTNIRIPVSMRRVGKEGLVGLGLKYAWCEIYALAGKPVRKTPFKYEFGTFNQPQATTSRALIYKDVMYRQWKKIGYPIQKFSRNIRDQFNH